MGWTPGPGPTSGDDTYVGDATDETVSGGDGNDTLNGGDGNDVLNGDAGNDTLILDVFGDHDTFNGGDGDDLIQIGSFGSTLTQLTIDGGADSDTLQIGLSANISSDSTFTGLETLVLLPANQTLPGSIFSGITILYATGQSFLNTSGTVDLSGINAPGTFTAGGFTYTNTAFVLRCLLASTGNVLIAPGSGSLIVSFVGSNGDDTLIGGANNDGLSGGLGNNVLNGNGGNDRIQVEGNHDTVDGGAGNDLLVVQGQGVYELDGGDGADVAQINAGRFLSGSTMTNVETVLFQSGYASNGIFDEIDTFLVRTSNISPTADMHMYGAGVIDLSSADVPDTFSISVGGVDINVTNAALRFFGSTGDDTFIFPSDSSVQLTASGDAGNDTLSGGADNDILNGGANDDTMSGGLGDDVYYVDSISDVIVENASEGIDAVLISVSGYTLTANVEVAAIQGGAGLSINGNSLANILYGAAGADTLNGGDGDDTLQGGGSADTLNGGLGNDTFYVAQVGDTVTENSGEGFDAIIVQMTSAYALADNVEVGATFLGSGVNITGNGLDNLLYGNAGADTLSGAGGNDFIQGAGGSDAMAGGLGNDTYFIEDAGDVITENSGEGADAAIVFTSSYTLAANVEVGARFLTTAYTLTGNALDNQLYGNNGNDTLNGGDGNDTIQGGAGNDTMVGGLGNDTYLVEQAGDVVSENASEGNDAVIVLIGSYTLAANVEVGATFLTSGVSITGNGLDNRLYGNTGADTLSGAAGADLLDGGAGADTLTGGFENDVFFFVAGQANGDTVTDFDGLGASAGDQLRFSGYGTLGGGASFVQLDATHWQINSADGTIHDTITLTNGASVDASDWLFV